MNLLHIMVSMLRDITEKKHTEQEHRSSWRPFGENCYQKHLYVAMLSQTRGNRPI